MYMLFLYSLYLMLSLVFIFVFYLANGNLLVMFNNDFCWVLKCNIGYYNKIFVNFYRNIKIIVVKLQVISGDKYLFPWLSIVLHWSTSVQDDSNLTCLAKSVRFR